MANGYARFATQGGQDVILDLSQMISCWEGKNPGCTVFHMFGIDEPIAVLVNFEDFVTDHLSYYDYRQAKEKPDSKPGSSPKLVAWKD